MSYSTELKLDSIFNVLPMSAKETRKYDNILRLLRNYAIEVRVI